MHRTLLAVFVGLTLAIVLGCAGTSLISQETTAMKSVTAAREVSIAALNSGQISVEQERKNKLYLDTLAASIKAAVAANNPAQVTAAQAKAEAFNPAKGQ